MEALHVMIEKAKMVDKIKGIRVGDGETLISHLFYADDAVFLGDWCKNNVHNIVLLLQCFFLASGLKLNIFSFQLTNSFKNYNPD